MNKTFKLILAVFIVALSMNLSFSQSYTTKEITSSFKKEQINDLKTIVDFFKDQISTNKNENFESAFNTILQRMMENGLTPIFETIDFEKQKQMYNSISPETFREIWTMGKMWKRNDTVTYKSISFTHNGNYLKFLRKLGKTQPILEKYSEDCMASGSVETYPYLQYNIYMLKEQFDLNNFNIQLLISIHYLTVNDDDKRYEKWNE